MFAKIEADSLKDLFIKAVEEKILSGQLKIGERLPPERELAASMGISRTIVHSGLVELAAKGIVSVNPRRGTYVTDYRRDGTTALLDSILQYTGHFDMHLLTSLIEMRYVMERETARLSALRRTEEDLERLVDIIRAEERLDTEDIGRIADLDFAFHHEIAIATRNMIYPLLIKSMESAYKALTREFFTKTHEYRKVFGFHRSLYQAIAEGNASEAEAVMGQILKHGEELIALYGS